MNNELFINWWNSNEYIKKNQISFDITINLNIIKNIFKDLIPILYIFCNKYEEQNFLENLQIDINKIFEINKNFKENNFFLNIFENIKYFKLNSLNQIINFINNFYFNPLNDFFMIQLPILIFDPFLTILTYCELFKQKNIIFKEFLLKKGSIEQIFDSLLPFCQSFIGFTDNIYWEFRLNLISLLINLILKYFDNILLIESLITNLRTKLLKLISDSPINISISFIRFIIELDKKSLTFIKLDLFNKRIFSLFNSINYIHLAQPILIKFILFDLSNYIDISQILLLITSQPIEYTWIIEETFKLSNNLNENIQLILLKWYFKIFCLSKIWSNFILNFLINLFNKIINNNLIFKWFEEFIELIRIFIILSNKKNKYKNRSNKLILFFNNYFNNNLIIKDLIINFNLKINDYDDNVENYKLEFPNLKYFPFLYNNLDFFKINNNFSNFKKKKNKMKKK